MKTAKTSKETAMLAKLEARAAKALKAVELAKSAMARKPMRRVKSVEAVKPAEAVQGSVNKALFRGDYGKIYDIGSHGSMPVSMLLRMASKAIHKSLAKTKYDLIVLANPNHRSNGHKSCNVAKRAGWVRLAPYKAA